MDSTAPARGSATAEYLDGAVLGLSLPRGPLAARAAQQAPPHDQVPVRNTALATDLGVVRVGTGTLEAHANWTEAMTCATQPGSAAEAHASLLDVTVLPGALGSVLHASQNLRSRTSTALIARDNRAASAARAEAGLSELDFIGGTVTARVLRQPALHVIATGSKDTSSVDYAAAVIEGTAPGLGARRLDMPGQTLDIPVSATGLTSLLAGLPLGLAARSALLRLSLGSATSASTDRQVTATATALRLQLLATSSPASVSAEAQELADTSSTLLDVSIGLLSASATAPHRVATAPPSCDTTACQLPITGANIGVAVGMGLLILIFGRLLLVLSVRRSRP